MKKIAFVSDIHLNEQFPIDHGVDAKRNWERIVEDLKAKNIKDVVFGGDIGEHTAHEWFFETLAPFSLKVVLGNHDQFVHVSRFYREKDNHRELYHQFEDKQDRYLFLDSSADRVSSLQLEWLETALRTPKRILLFIHHPVVQIDTPLDALYPLENRGAVKRILKAKAGAVTVFCGHYHMNDERREDNIRQITTQASSYQIVKQAGEVVIDTSEYGYRIIEIDEERISTRLVTFGGKS